MAEDPGTIPEREADALWATYRRTPVTLVRGEGCWVETDDGRRLLDLVGGIAVNVVGHCHPEVVSAASQQMGRLMHTSNLYYTVPQVELAERLVRTAFPARAFLCNSGAEANEAAIKVARKWGRLHRGGAYTIVTLRGAFHGRTLATLAATGNRHYGDPFEPLPRGFRQVEKGDLDAVEATLEDAAQPVAAVMAEPIQGESGVHPLSDAYLRGLRRLCDQHDVLLILDEVQSGMGRSGRWWAHQWSEIHPDVMTVAKGVGGGLPLAATLVAERADVMEAGDHGSTFGGNPVAAAAGLAVLRVIEENHLLERALTAGDQLREGLLGLAAGGLPIREVRGRGLLLGVGLSRPVAAAAAAFALDEGVLVNPIGARTLRLAPPLVISDDEVEIALGAIDRALGRAVAGAGG